ncbi:MAG TPA: helix-hairpin-helix domain-containing protein [Acidimicrobiales bacterium]|nr:helix-hairpin-helix domain-containing protein [Acidimicrobiales bacterium]
MSDLSAFPTLSDPPRGAPPRTWRDRLSDLTAGVELSPGRVAAGAVAVCLAAVVAWRLLAPPPAPPEMSLPFAEQSAAAPAPAATGVAGAATTAPPGGPATPPGPGAAAAAGGGAAGEVVVHVVGAVVTPGVQRLPSGSRTVDAVDAAGGTVPEADLARLNLAAVLTDGQQVYVPRLGEVAPPVAAGGAAPGAPGGPATAAAPVDLNAATLAQLDELPGIGPTTAQAIIDHREQNGPFASVEELLDVRGIGDAKLEQLRDLVTV